MAAAKPHPLPFGGWQGVEPRTAEKLLEKAASSLAPVSAAPLTDGRRYKK